MNIVPTNGTPQPTSETSFDGSTTTSSISHPGENVNRNFSTNSEMGSHSISTMLEARFGPGVNDYLNTTNKIRDTADRINGLERPKPNEGYAQKNDISTYSITSIKEKINTSD